MSKIRAINVYRYSDVNTDILTTEGREAYDVLGKVCSISAPFMVYYDYKTTPKCEAIAATLAPYVNTSARIIESLWESGYIRVEDDKIMENISAHVYSARKYHYGVSVSGFGLRGDEIVYYSTNYSCESKDEAKRLATNCRLVLKAFCEAHGDDAIDECIWKEYQKYFNIAYAPKLTA